MNCPICSYSAEVESSLRVDGSHVNCRTCGIFRISRRLLHTLPRLEPDERASLSAATRNATERDELLSLSTENFREVIAAMLRFSAGEKADMLLGYLAKRSERPGALAPITEAHDYPVA